MSYISFNPSWVPTAMLTGLSHIYYVDQAVFQSLMGANGHANDEWLAAGGASLWFQSLMGANGHANAGADAVETFVFLVSIPHGCQRPCQPTANCD